MSRQSEMSPAEQAAAAIAFVKEIEAALKANVNWHGEVTPKHDESTAAFTVFYQGGVSGEWFEAEVWSIGGGYVVEGISGGWMGGAGNEPVESVVADMIKGMKAV